MEGFNRYANRLPPGQQFDRYSKRYMCCCGRTHILIAARIVSIISLCGVVSLHIFFWGIGILYTIATFFLGMAVMILLIIGIQRERSAFFFPYFVYQIFYVFVIIGLAIAFAVAISTDSNYFFGSECNLDTSTGYRAANAVLLVIFITDFFVQIWFTFIIFKCYQFFVERNCACPTHTIVPPPSMYNVMYAPPTGPAPPAYSVTVYPSATIYPSAPDQSPYGTANNAPSPYSNPYANDQVPPYTIQPSTNNVFVKPAPDISKLSP